MEKKQVKFASEDIIAVEEIAEQLASELNLNEDVDIVASEDVVPIVEDESNDGVATAEKILAELPDEEKIICDDDEADKILAEANALEEEIDAQIAEDEKCPDCGEQPCACNKAAEDKTASEEKVAEEKTAAEEKVAEDKTAAEEKAAEEKVAEEKTASEEKTAAEENVAEDKTASETKPGIEDKIGDEANGGDPSVSDLPDTKIDCDSDKEVFGQNTDSEYVASIVKRLDIVAAALEKRNMVKMAFRVDQLTDQIEASIRNAKSNK